MVAAKQSRIRKGAAVSRKPVSATLFAHYGSFRAIAI